MENNNYCGKAGEESFVESILKAKEKGMKKVSEVMMSENETER